jgi:spore coat protein U-like protein
MISGANKLAYNVYTSSADAQIMGNGTGGTSLLSESGTVTAGQQYILNGVMYGSVPALQDVPAGTYMDELILTVSY